MFFFRRYYRINGVFRHFDRVSGVFKGGNMRMRSRKSSPTGENASVTWMFFLTRDRYAVKTSRPGSRTLAWTFQFILISIHIHRQNPVHRDVLSIDATVPAVYFNFSQRYKMS